MALEIARRTSTHGKGCSTVKDAAVAFFVASIGQISCLLDFEESQFSPIALQVVPGKCPDYRVGSSRSLLCISTAELRRGVPLADVQAERTSMF